MFPAMTTEPEDVTAAAERVLAFWFEELAPAQWWRTDPAVDAACGARFGALHAALRDDVDLAWLMTPERALAAVIVLDQFSRNLHRGEAAAYAQDAKARSLAEDAIAKGLDVPLPPERRHFLYMPFMHSEETADQERAMELFATLGEDMLAHARQHKAVIDRFGRFPTRNAVLGRESTPEEVAYLRERGGGAV